MPKDMNFDANYLKDLKNAQIIGQGKRAGIWEDYQEENNEHEEDELTGKVVEVHSGDSLTIERDNDFKLIRVFLSSIKAPKHNHDVQENYGWESKESLRKLAISKKVRCVIEYTKTMENKMTMSFGSVFLISKQEKNLAAKQLEKGLARSSLNKEHLSKYLEELL